MCDINSTSRVDILAQNQRNSLSYTGRTSRHRSCSQKVGCLQCSIARIYDLWDRSLEKRNVRGFSPLLWSGWQSSSSTATPHRQLHIQWSIPAKALVYAYLIICTFDQLKILYTRAELKAHHKCFWPFQSANQLSTSIRMKYIFYKRSFSTLRVTLLSLLTLFRTQRIALIACWHVRIIPPTVRYNVEFVATL